MARTIAPSLRLAVLLLVAVLPLAGPASVAAQPACLTPEEAARRIGERGCVEGVITAVVYARQSTGQPTFLDMGAAFTAVIWTEDRAKFDPPPESWRGRRARITGRIESYRGKAQIVLREPGQLAATGAPAAATQTATVTRTPAATLPPAPTPAPVATQPPTAAPTPLAASTVPAANPTSTPAGEAAIVRATVAPAASATAALAPAPAAPPAAEDGQSRALLLGGVALLAAGGGGGAWLALRRRADR